MNVCPEIEILMFGGLALRRSEQTCNLHLCGPTRQLLAFLLYQANQEFRRERLIDLLWPDKEATKARSALNTALWRIRKALGEHRLDQIELSSETETVGIRLGPDVEIDTQTLTDLVKRHDAESSDTAEDPDAGPCSTQTALARMLSASKGLFLDGDDADWILVERERLINVYMRGQSQLLGAYAKHSDFERALACGRDILEIDPLHEGVQRQVMWLYLLNGQRARAIRQYRDCAALLKAELGIAPMPETSALYQHIIQDTRKAPEHPDPDAVRLGNFQTRFSLVSTERRAVLDTLVDTRA